MFTGIVQGRFQVIEVIKQPGLLHYSVQLTPELLTDLKIGASVSIDGTCQTVVKIESSQVWFDAIQETLNRTHLHSLQKGSWVNVERAARMGQEIGGHVLSGHIYGTAQIVQFEKIENTWVLALKCNPEWMKYFFVKGFIALDGVSLTLVDVQPSGTFSTHLIPETVKVTTFGHKKVGDWINVEIDPQTQAIVETVERVLRKSGK